MTPDERIAAIREQLPTQREQDSEEVPQRTGVMVKLGDINWLISEHMKLTTALEAMRLVQQIETSNFEIARDAQTELAALRDVAEAAEGMPEPVGPYGACVVCGVMPPHRDKCPYGLLQSALQRWREAGE